MSINTTESTPPPKIGKIGPYTVFITPPPTPTSNGGNATPKPVLSPKKPVTVSPSPVVQAPPPPVQAPPMQIPKSASTANYSSESFGFFWDAVAKVQNAHASLDEHVARWFGLNQSKYQWALDDYYESKGINQKDGELKDASNKV